MTLDEFCIELCRELDAFKAQWLEGRADDPDLYPMNMDEADWHEQFMAWVTTP